MFWIFFKSCCTINPNIYFQVSTSNQKKQCLCFSSGRPDVWKIQFAQPVRQQTVYQHACGTLNQLTQNYLSFIRTTNWIQHSARNIVICRFKIPLKSKVIIVSIFSRPDTWAQLYYSSMSNGMPSHLTCFRVYSG